MSSIRRSSATAAAWIAVALAAGAFAQDNPRDAGAAPGRDAPASIERGTMTASFVEGSATVSSPGGEAHALAEGARLREGDRVETGPDGRVEVELATGTLVRIGPGSRVELREAAPGGTAFRARLLLGNLWARVHKLVAGERFEVETENAVAGVRGTEFRVEAGGSGKEDLLRVYEGAVECKGRSGGWAERVEPARELRFGRGKPAGPAAFDKVSEARHPFMSWVRERGEKRGRGKGPELKPGRERKHDDRKEEKPKDKKSPLGDDDKGRHHRRG